MLNLYYTIGISGHRDLRSEDLDKIEAALTQKIISIRDEVQPNSLRVIVGSADGVDSLFIKVLENFNDIQVINLDQVVSQNTNDNIEYYFAAQATYLVENSDEIIVVWDGIFNYKLGGTSDVVRLALDKHKLIHHLICPRKSNPFPINSLAGNSIDHDSKKFTRIPFTVNFSWNICDAKTSEGNSSSFINRCFKFFFKLVLNPLSLNYFFPITLTVLTIVLGTIGFQKIYDEPFLNNFFRAVNLLTFNHSVIETNSNVDLYLNIARILGLITVIYAFTYALNLALKSKKDDIRRRLWLRRKDGFIVILGLNEKSLQLLYDLASHPKNRIVLLTEDVDSVYNTELSKIKNLIVVHGSLTSSTSLKSLYILDANEIYIFSNNDTVNIRSTQEIDILKKNSSSTTEQQIYVHIKEEHHAKFLRGSLMSVNDHTHIFNIYDNSVRRLFLHHPPDRFYQYPEIECVHSFIIGFEEMGKQMLRSFLKHCHFQKGKSHRITVYAPNHTFNQEWFNQYYPMFKDASNENEALHRIQNSTWNAIEVEFLELPKSDQEWLSDNQVIYKCFKNSCMINVYSCLLNDIDSAACLHTILPKINFLSNEHCKNVQIFCYNNFADKKEEQNIEAYLNRIAPDIFVRCFGNLLDECRSEVIRGMSLNELGKLINAFYFDANQFKSQSHNVLHWPLIDSKRKNDLWNQTSSKDRLSSLRAGDHLWTKIRIIHSLNGWNFKIEDFDLSPEILEILSETEHRRWCAELLLQGFTPFNFPVDSDEYKNMCESWSDKEFKHKILNIRKSINLVPYEYLTSTESQKDQDQIIAIPYFLRNILKV